MLEQLGKSTGKPHRSQIFIKGFFDGLTAKKPKQLICSVILHVKGVDEHLSYVVEEYSFKRKGLIEKS